MLIRMTCRHIILNWQQVIEVERLGDPCAGNRDASYMDRNREFRSLCGSTQLLLGGSKLINYGPPARALRLQPSRTRGWTWGTISMRSMLRPWRARTGGGIDDVSQYSDSGGEKP